jgi:LSD1 subclass zinc finger protein
MSVLAQALAALIPPLCCACRSAVGPGDVICASCRRALPWLRGALCGRCALPEHPPGDACPAASSAFSRAWAPVAYAGPARAVVGAVKFEGVTTAIAAMAAAIAACVPPELVAGATLVPVPAHPSRRRTRGFDQALLLARALANRTGLPLAPILRRRAAGPPQLASTRAQRLGGNLEVYAIARPPPRVALVDDVHTTGATFDVCARTLRAWGAEEVVAIAFARTL